ncbi:MAG: hypothetical protein KBC48_00225 [Candidatus Pacebacteria bacterium]|nr:hypothetical protein [Candidatus Paceibacterota bacterium]
MATKPKIPNPSENVVTLATFLQAYNSTIPGSFPKATLPLLKKYKEEHASLFKEGDSWSLDLHRKKIMDWLPNQLRG